MSKRVQWLLSILLAAARAHAAQQTLPLSATLNQQSVGDLEAVVQDDQLSSLNINPIRPKLEELLTPERYTIIRTNTAPMLPISVLEAAGVKTHFEFQSLSIQLSIPTELRSTQHLNLIGNRPASSEAFIGPSGFSGYLNLRGGVAYTEASQAGVLGWSVPELDLLNVFNLHGVVLENDTVLNPSPLKNWEKRDSRLVWDQPDRRLRWELGDLSYPVSGFQGFLPMAGLSLRREDSLQPYRITQPLGQSAFFLKEDSKVDILVNGHTVQSLQMTAGPHQITNFPLASGANDVTLRITDAVGRVEYIKTALFYDPGLLKPGETEFNYALGMPSMIVSDDPFYQYNSLPALSAFHRWGLTDFLTVGANGQATKDTQVGGGQIVVATLVGTFGYDAGYSYDPHVGGGYAHRLQYNYYAPHAALLSDGVLSLSGQYQDGHFTQPNPFATATCHPDITDVQARYSQRIFSRCSAGVGYLRQWMDGQMRQESYDFRTGYSWRRMRAEVTVEHTERYYSPSSWGAYFTLHLELGHGLSLFATEDTGTHASRAEWQYNPSDPIEAVNASLGVVDTPASSQGYGTFRYTGRRAEMMLSQDTFNPSESRTSLSWGTALVYADGTFGVSSPVSDSFALIESTGALHQEGGLAAQPQGQIYQAQEDWMGPAVLNKVTSYYPTHLAIEPRQSESDFDPQKGEVMLQTTYHSGTRLRFGQDTTARITATLLWSNGQPARVQAGTLTGPDGAVTEFISNREGLVYLQSLKPGTYTGTLLSHPDKGFTLTIPATTQKDLSLEPIHVPLTP